MPRPDARAPRSNRPGRFAALAPLFAVVLGACEVHVDHPHAHPVTPDYDVWESEPNDSHCCPDDMGSVSVGDAFVIGGTIRDDAYDPYDGFELANVQPCAIRFYLEPLDGVSDLDLCVWDPAIGDFAFCFDSANAYEEGVFEVSSSWNSFHLVVASYSGDCEYRLYVECEPIGLGLTAAAEVRGPHKALEFDGYGPANDAVEEPGARLLARGVMLEIDPVSGEFETASIEWYGRSER